MRPRSGENKTFLGPQTYAGRPKKVEGLQLNLQLGIGTESVLHEGRHCSFWTGTGSKPCQERSGRRFSDGDLRCGEPVGGNRGAEKKKTLSL